MFLDELVVRKIALVTSIGVHRVDLTVAIAVGHERDTCAIRRPHRRTIAARRIGKLVARALLEIDHVDIEVTVSRRFVADA